MSATKVTLTERPSAELLAKRFRRLQRPVCLDLTAVYSGKAQEHVLGGNLMTKKPFEATTVSRRTLLQGSAGLIGGTMLPGAMTSPAMAADQPPIGTWPAGSQGNTVFIGASV